MPGFQSDNRLVFCNNMDSKRVNCDRIGNNLVSDNRADCESLSSSNTSNGNISGDWTDGKNVAKLPIEHRNGDKQSVLPFNG